MSKSSTVTSREAVESAATATAGGLTIHGETFVIETDQRIELVDLTNRVMEFVQRFNIREGLVSLWSMHTTCTLFINEFQTALLVRHQAVPRADGRARRRVDAQRSRSTRTAIA